MKKIKDCRGCRLVTEEDLQNDMRALVEAAREGRLVIVPTPLTGVSRENVIGHVRAYVRKIRQFAQPEWTELVDEVWEEIFRSEEFMAMLLPGPKARRCRTFNKYNVMRMVGVLRSRGVYDDGINDSQLCATLEDDLHDNCYRAYIGLGFEQRCLLAKMRELLQQVRARRS